MKETDSMGDIVLGTVLALPFVLAICTALAGEDGAAEIFVGVGALLAPGVGVYVLVGGVLGVVGGIALTGTIGYWFWKDVGQA